MTKEFPNDPNLEQRDSDFGIFVIPSSFVIRILSLVEVLFHYEYEQEVETKHIYVS
jgi:hypothetical protein